MNYVELEKDKKLLFEEETHKYTYEGEVQESVTTFISSLHEPFDEQEMSKKVAEKRKVPQKQILKEWAKTRKDSQDFGNKIHLYCENIMNWVKQRALRTCDKNAREKAYRRGANKFFAEHFHLLPVSAELPVCVPELKLAGTVDGIMQTKDGKIFLYDWKTSKRIDVKSYYGKTFLHPFEDIDDCNYNKYSFQLGIYKWMIEYLYGIKIDGCYIVHLKENTYKEYKTRDFSEEIDYLMMRRLEEIENGKKDKDVCSS